MKCIESICLKQDLLVNHRWWKNLDIERKFPFARDRLVEMYLWMSIVHFESDYEAAREILTKVASMVSIIDDINDVNGTLEELGLFTEAIERYNSHSNAFLNLPILNLFKFDQLFIRVECDTF